ncbi:MAG: DAK2 domain-containing protein, partial [Butyrivibrio sp.]|nr:DAK2 domain-containing protein [Butyrivibrio sp.]
GDAGILAVGKGRETVVKDMIGKLADDESSLISVYYGNDIAKEEAQALQSALEEAYGDFDVEFQYGGQPVYYYIVSVE